MKIGYKKLYEVTHVMNAFDFENEIDKCASINIDWSKLDNKTIMITGATGLIGKYLIQVLMQRNINKSINTKVIAVGRSKENFEKRFKGIVGMENVSFFEHDVQKPCAYDKPLDFVIHMASNTHPRLYASDPIGTEMINIFGTYYLLELIAKNPGCRFMFTSSGDIYGDNRSGKEYLEETDCGYIDCNTLRAGYIEGKRASEALCNAYRETKGVDFVISRLCRVFGPTMNLEESKAISQFILKAVANEDIVLKSTGTQTFSYLYIFDAVAALLFVMTKGKTGEAYNIADNKNVLSLKELADILAEIGKSRVVFELPDEFEMKGASTFQDVKLDAKKLYNLGWKSKVEVKDGLKWTVSKMRSDWD